MCGRGKQGLEHGGKGRMRMHVETRKGISQRNARGEFIRKRHSSHYFFGREAPALGLGQQRFEILAEWISANLGHPLAFMLALTIVFVWAVIGPVFNYSDTWQLVINTGTTIVTFLMVFLLQNTGNRTIEELHDRLRSVEQQNKELLDAIKAMNNAKN